MDDREISDAFRGLMEVSDSLSNERQQEKDQTVAGGLMAIAHALHQLGNADAGTPQGGLEALGGTVLTASERIADSLDGVAHALEEMAAK